MFLFQAFKKGIKVLFKITHNIKELVNQSAVFCFNRGKAINNIQNRDYTLIKF